MTKKNPVFLFIPECRLSYEKIVQTSGMTKKNPVFLFILHLKLHAYRAFTYSLFQLLHIVDMSDAGIAVAG